MNWITNRLRGPLITTEFSPIDQWFRDFFADNNRLANLQTTRAMPRADVAETDKDFLVTLELPGMEESDVEVKISGNQLFVTGERKQRKEDKDKHFYRVETSYGAFERTFELPDEVRKDAQAVKATFSKGLLEIRIPKVEPRPVARIPIKTA